jgi:hypothetical protein
MTKTRPAPLGATYKRNVRLGWSDPRSDVAPSGAKRALFKPSYKDFAPTELRRSTVKIANSADEQELIPTVNRGRRLQYGTIRI